MSVSQADLDDFQRFAAEKLANEGAASMSELLRQWEESRERRETIASIKRGVADVEAGRTRPAEDVLDELRSELDSK